MRKDLDAIPDTSFVSDTAQPVESVALGETMKMAALSAGQARRNTMASISAESSESSRRPSVAAADSSTEFAGPSEGQASNEGQTVRFGLELSFSAC